MPAGFQPPTCASLDAEDVLRAAARSLPPGVSPTPDSIVGLLRCNKFPLLSLTSTTVECRDVSLRAILGSDPFQSALHEDRALYDRVHSHYLELAHAWQRANIPCVCIKSVGIKPSFPYTSDNYDLLVPAEQVDAARSILLGLGYVELTNNEEHLKWLFKLFVAGRSLCDIHLHARVGWGEGFMLEDQLWRGVRSLEDDAMVLAPSREDGILINAAHALFENKSFSLHDIVKIRYAAGRGDIDWRYLDDVAAERGWLTGLHFALLLVSDLERHLFGSSSIPPDQQERFETTVQQIRWLKGYYGTLRASRPILPFQMSFAVAKALFFKKLWSDRRMGPIKKGAHTVTALGRGVKGQSGIRPQNSMLIALSGIDGSGKTSQAKSLVSAFDLCAIRSRRVWARAGATPLLHALRQIPQRRATGGADREEAEGSGGVSGRRGWRLTLWGGAAAVDYALWLLHVRWRLLRGDVVVADRYLCDFDVEFSTRLNSQPRLAQSLLRVLTRVAATPARAYLLRVDPSLAESRELPDEGDLDLANQAGRYEQASQRYDLRVLNANEPFDVVSAELERDVIGAYMSTFGPRTNAIFFSNPGQLNPRRNQGQPGESS